ncbi:MAG: hypothetical protein M1838_004740 [Thelocarpon superellum]|nr:MAG: hypothetical protein M1838_004740 [Thelocarpon superellum]
MAMGVSIMEHIDQQLSVLFSGWSVYTTAITVVLIAFVVYPWLTWSDPDIHPLLLSRQAYSAPVRNLGESAVHRSAEAAYGYPLKTGLGIKDAGAPQWKAGRDGDLRDIWRRAAGQSVGQDGKLADQKAKVFTILGRDEIIEHSPAAAYYDLTPILLPYDQSPATVLELLRQTGPDFLIAAAGTVPLSDLAEKMPKVHEVMWVVQPGSRHMDWNEEPQGVDKHLKVSVWHELVEGQRAATSADLPGFTEKSQPAKDVVTVWQKEKDGSGEMVQFTQKNIVAGISALLTSLPPRQRLNPSDLFLPADALSFIYPLTLTLAALFSGASLALNSVAGPGADLTLASRGVAPTVIAISAETAAAAHEKAQARGGGILSKISHWLHSRTLAAGHLPQTVQSLFTSINNDTAPATATTPGKLRILYVSDRAQTSCPALSSTTLSDLRIYAGARVIYALTAAKVAGAIAQTNIYDYRRDEDPSATHAHFGVPLSSLEIKLVDTPTHKTTDEGRPQGEIIVTGPSVAGGEAALGVVGAFREDGTLAYV